MNASDITNIVQGLQDVSDEAKNIKLFMVSSLALLVFIAAKVK